RGERGTSNNQHPRVSGRRFWGDDDGGAVVAEAGELIGRCGLGDDFEEAIVFAGRLRQQEALQGGTVGDVFPALFFGGFVFLTEAGDFGDDYGLGAFASDPVVAALAFGGAAEDGFGEG